MLKLNVKYVFEILLNWSPSSEIYAPFPQSERRQRHRYEMGSVLILATPLPPSLLLSGKDFSDTHIFQLNMQNFWEEVRNFKG